MAHAPETLSPAHGRGLRGWFARLEPSALAGLLMMAACVIALAWANSPWASSYTSLFGTRLTLGFGDAMLAKPLVLWINDGLMAIFFLLVGLEIKREILGGELASMRRAALPVIAAIGGMAVPAALFLIVNPSGEAARGWAIPAATDIAFALGIMALLGNRVPLALKIFLTTVAVVDDIGAVLMIALFYTAELSLPMLAGAGGVLLVLVALNRLGVRANVPYIVAGIVLWFLVLKSGVHATVAGVLLAMTIPARGRIDAVGFRDNVQNFLGDDDEPGRDSAGRVRSLLDQHEPLLLRWEHALSPGVLFVIMPIFALANAGVSLGNVGLSALASGAGLGVALGLLLGKPIGVMLASFIAVRTRLASLPGAGAVSWAQVHGAAWLAGIGFTMSLFIADLAFPANQNLLDAAKIGLLSASAAAALIGVALLVTTARRATAASADKPSAALGEQQQT